MLDSLLDSLFACGDRKSKPGFPFSFFVFCFFGKWIFCFFFYVNSKAWILCCRNGAKAPADAQFTGAAYYPRSIAAEGGVSLSGEANPLCAILEQGSNVLHFKHIGAYISIDLRGIPAEAARVVVASESTAFRGDFALTDGVWNASGAAGKVEFPVAGADMQLTLPVPVGSYTVSYRLEEDGGNILLERTTDGDFTFERAHRYAFPAENLEPTSELFEITVELEDFDLDDDDDYWV